MNMTRMLSLSKTRRASGAARDLGPHEKKDNWATIPQNSKFSVTTHGLNQISQLQL